MGVNYRLLDPFRNRSLKNILVSFRFLCENIEIKAMLFYRYTSSRSFSQFLGQRFCSERTLEKLRTSLIFKVFSRIVSGESIKPKNLENDRERI